MRIPEYKYKIGTDELGAPVYISSKQLQLHTQVLASSGRGKSSFFELIIRQMIKNGEGFTLIDPHGALYDNVVAWITRYNYHRRRKIHLIEPKEAAWTYAFNPLYLREEYRADGVFDDMISERIYAVMNAIAAAWDDEIKNMPLYQRYFTTLQYVLASHNLALSEATELIPTHRQLVREALTAKLTDEVYKGMWIEMTGLSGREYKNDTSSTLNRILGIFNTPRMREMFGATKNVVDLQSVMDEGDIVLVNLATSPLFGAQASEAFGKILINTMLCAARGRVANKSRPHYMFIDECYNYLSDDIPHILVETRKFGLHLILAHHHLGQLLSAGQLVHDGVLSGAQTKVVLGGLTPKDAEVMADIMNVYDYSTFFEGITRHEIVGYENVLFRNTAQSIGISETYTEGGQRSTSIHTPLEGDASETASEGSSDSYSHGRSETKTEGYSEGLRPILEEKLSQMKSPEVLRGEAASRLRSPGTQSGYIYDEEHEMLHVRFDTLPDDRSKVERNIKQVKQKLRESNPYIFPRESVQLEMKERQDYLLSFGATHADGEDEADEGQELDWDPGDDEKG